VQLGQSQASNGDVLTLSGDPSVFIAYVPEQEMRATVPKQLTEAIVPFADYDATVPKQLTEAIV
jgi:hypothetical protein